MRSFCLSNLFRNTIFAAAALLASTALPSQAEILTFVEIQVPFAFNVGNVSLPAGSYEVLQPHEMGALIVRAAGGSGAVAAIVGPLHEGAGHQASFVHVGGKYFLSSISLGDGRMVQLAPPSMK
jgi:hypothetical protein